MAPLGGLFVYATVASMRALGTAYGPQPSVAALAITAVELDAYAPPSRTRRSRTAIRRPSASAACSYSMCAG